MRNIADYQARATVMYLKMWIHDEMYADATYSDVCEAYILMLLQGSRLMSNISPFDMIMDFAHDKLPSAFKKLPEIIKRKKQ